MDKKFGKVRVSIIEGPMQTYQDQWGNLYERCPVCTLLQKRTIEHIRKSCIGGNNKHCQWLKAHGYRAGKRKREEEDMPGHCPKCGIKGRCAIHTFKG